MDRLTLITLRAEMQEDLRHALEAVRLARERFEKGGAIGQESCAFQLVRFFNIIEQMGQRVVKSFENHLDERQGWHAELIRRLSISVPGIRPALYTSQILPSLHDLRGFRHVVTHAYDLVLDSSHQVIVLSHAERIGEVLPGLVDQFIAEVARVQRWALE